MNWIAKKLELDYGGKKTLKSMEGLRGIAVFLVFLVHYCGQIDPWLKQDGTTIFISKIISNLGHVGVDLFFVLSGYLIYGNLIKRNSTMFGQYIIRRIIRIYPTFLVVFAVYIFLSFLIESENKLPPSVLDAVIYISQNLLLLPGLFDIKPIITVAWSLSYEFAYYLTIPLAITLLNLRKKNPHSRILLWLLISAAGFTYCFIAGGQVRLLMFISGIILYELHVNTAIPVKNYMGTLCLIAGLFVFGIRSFWGLSYVTAILIIFFLFMILCLESFRNETNGTSRWLSVKPLRYLGNMSYSYYLVH